MTENDYIAEYVKERCPEVIQTVDFAFWKLEKSISEFGEEIVKSFRWHPKEDKTDGVG